MSALHADTLDDDSAALLLADLGPIRLRPLSLADRVAFMTFGHRLTAEDLRLRFAHPVKPDDEFCTRLLTIDHWDVEAFGAFDREGSLLGVGRIARIANADAEIGLIVRSDLKRHGLGRVLLERLVRHAQAMGFTALHSDILSENLAMREFAQRAGFVFDRYAGPMIEGHLPLGR